MKILNEILDGMDSRQPGFAKDLRLTIEKEWKESIDHELLKFAEWCQKEPTAKQFYSNSPESLLKYYKDQLK